MDRSFRQIHLRLTPENTDSQMISHFDILDARKKDHASDIQEMEKAGKKRKNRAFKVARLYLDGPIAR